MTPQEGKRFLLDSNVYDQLVVTPEIQRRVIEVLEASTIELLMTHIQHDELNRTGLAGGSRLWKQGWSHGDQESADFAQGAALQP